MQIDDQKSWNPPPAFGGKKNFVFCKKKLKKKNFFLYLKKRKKSLNIKFIKAQVLRKK